jgi:hypothetical protein
MANGTNDNDIKKFIATIIISLIGATGINQGLQMSSEETRHDPFTGTDGKLLKAEIINYMVASQTQEERECREYRAGIEKRLSKVEILQEHIIRELSRRGIELKP